MHRPTALSVLAAAALAATLAACEVRPPPGQFGQTASVAPPPPRVETIPPAPAPAERVVWVPGHWTWDGREYVWESGHYIERRAPGAAYESGRWEQTARGWTWVPGYWR